MKFNRFALLLILGLSWSAFPCARAAPEETTLTMAGEDFLINPHP